MAAGGGGSNGKSTPGHNQFFHHAVTKHGAIALATEIQDKELSAGMNSSITCLPDHGLNYANNGLQDGTVELGDFTYSGVPVRVR